MDSSLGFSISGSAFWRTNVSNMGTHYRRDLQYVPRDVFGRIFERLSYRWRTVSLGSHDILEEMGAVAELDHGLDQRIWMDRVGGVWRPFRKPTDHWRHFLHEP